MLEPSQTEVGPAHTFRIQFFQAHFSTKLIYRLFAMQSKSEKLWQYAWNDW
jgi:hypothetical protein